MRRWTAIVALFGVIAGFFACAKKPTPKEPTITETVSDAGGDEADVSAPEPPAEKALFERLGGKDGVAKIVDSLVKAIMAEPKLKLRFAKAAKGAKLEKLKQALNDQLCTLTGGPEEECSYDKEMADVHRGMRVTEGEWNLFLSAFKSALDENEVPEPAQNDLRALLAPMHDDIVTVKPKPKAK